MFINSSTTERLNSFISLIDINIPSSASITVAFDTKGVPPSFSTCSRILSSVVGYRSSWQRPGTCRFYP